MTGLSLVLAYRKILPEFVRNGEVDELNAVLGVARATELPKELDDILNRVQHSLFAIGAELATPDPEPIISNGMGPNRSTRSKTPSIGSKPPSRRSRILFSLGERPLPRHCIWHEPPVVELNERSSP